MNHQVPSKLVVIYRMSRECLSGTQHFLKCPQLNCSCFCHKMDKEKEDTEETKEK